MLVLTRKLNEGLVIGGDIFISVMAVDNGEGPCIELGINLPDILAISLPNIDLGPKGDECK
jgi:carbon storage regulator CsrA